MQSCLEYNACRICWWKQQRMRPTRPPEPSAGVNLRGVRLSAFGNFLSRRAWFFIVFQAWPPSSPRYRTDDCYPREGESSRVFWKYWCLFWIVRGLGKLMVQSVLLFFEVLSAKSIESLCWGPKNLSGWFMSWSFDINEFSFKMAYFYGYEPCKLKIKKIIFLTEIEILDSLKLQFLLNKIDHMYLNFIK